jgi:hypothetical protein
MTRVESQKTRKTRMMGEVETIEKWMTTKRGVKGRVRRRWRRGRGTRETVFWRGVMPRVTRAAETQTRTTPKLHTQKHTGQLMMLKTGQRGTDRV